MATNRNFIVKNGLEIGEYITKMAGVAPTNGQLLIGDSVNGRLSVNTLSVSNGMVVTNGPGTITLSTNATSSNTASTIVSRNSSGNFSAGLITAETGFSGNGSLLTSLNADNITSGTLSVSRGGTGLNSVGSANQLLSTNNAGTGLVYKSVLSGAGITASITNSDITISHTDTSSVSNLVSDNSGGNFIQDINFTFDTFGHVTGASVAVSSILLFSNAVIDNTDVGYTWSAVDNTTVSADSSSDSLTFVAGGGITVDADVTNDAIRISHADTSSQSSVANSGNTFIQGISVDTYGHITGITSAQTIIGDGQFSVVAGAGLSGGGVLGTANQAANTSLTLSHADTSSVSNLAVDNGSGTFVQDISFAFDTYGHVTGASVSSGSFNAFSTVQIDNTDTEYTWVTIDGTQIIADSFQDTMIVVAGPGIDVAASSTSDAIRISHEDTSSVPNLSSDNSGLTVIQDLSLTFDTFGHVTGATAGTSTLAISTEPGDDVYSEKIRLSSTTSGTDDIVLAVGAVDSVYGLTIEENADTITLKHANTSSWASTTNSGYALIQNIGLDTYGHLTSINTLDLTPTLEQITGFQSFSDFADGTLVTTSINATVAQGDSFILEITGKSYSSTNAPFKVTLQGYIYDNTFISASAISYGGAFAPYIRILEQGGNLCFWWQRISYWNSFEVTVKKVSVENTIPRNVVTNITNSVEPVATKTIVVTPITNYAFGKISIDNTDSGYTWQSSDETQVISDTVGDTFTIVAGAGIDVAADTVNDAIRISHEDTSSQPSVDNSGYNFIQDITLDTYGHITAISSGSVSYSISTEPGDTVYSEKIRLTSGGSSITSDDIILAVGAVDSTYGLTIEEAGDTITLKHADTSSVSNLTSDNSDGTFIQDLSLTFDTYGHVTGATVATATAHVFKTVEIDNSDSGYTWVETDGSQVVADTLTDTLKLVASPGIVLAADAASDAIRIRHEDTSSVANLSSDNLGFTFIQDAALTFDTFGHVTGATVGTASISLTTLAGADAYSEKIRMSSSSGSANNDVTLAVGATDSTYGLTVSHSTGTITFSHADTSAVGNVNSNNSGNVFIQDIALTFDTFGHVTGATVGTSTVVETPAFSNITIDSAAGGYTWSAANTNSTQAAEIVGDTLTIVPGDGINIYASTVAGIDALKFEHSDTSSVSNLSSSNSGPIVIQSLSLTFDTFGHVTGATTSTVNLDNQYVKKSGDTMTGRLVVPNGSTGGIAFPNDSYGGSGDTATITLETKGGEATVLKIKVQNEADDTIEFETPSSTGVKINSSTVWHAGNDGTGSGLDADLLDGQDGSYYLNWPNITNKPDPVITVTLTGDVAGSADTTLTDLTSGTISVATTIQPNSVALGTDTTGNYVASVTGGTGVTITGTPGEGWAPTVSIGQDVSTTSNVTFNDLTVSGNLTVNGTTTRINSTVTTLDDPVLTLGGDTAPTSNDSKDRGIEFRWHDGTTAKLGFFGFDRSSQQFTFIPDATNVGEVFSGTKGTFDVNVDWSNVTSKPDPVITVTLTGDVAGSANTTLTDLTGGTITISTTVQPNSVALGTDTTGNYVADIAASGNGISISGTAGEGWTPTVVSNATSSNTASTIVFRDASGNFSAGTITASLSGNASTATTLQTARTINGVSFNGSANITINAVTPNALTAGSGLTGGSFDGSVARTFAIDTSIVATLSDTQTLSNKSLVDSSTTFIDNLDSSKRFRFEASAVSASTTRVLTVPNASGTIALTSDIPPAPTVNNGNLVFLAGNGITISADAFSANKAGDALVTISSNATTLNTASSIVQRDSSGNFSAGTITATLNGNSSTASQLATARTIGATGDATWSVTFNGSANVSAPITLATVNAAPVTNTLAKITVNGKGLVTSSVAAIASDITSILGYTPVNRAGDTMTGLLTLSGAPTSSLHAATKAYVDSAVSSAVGGVETILAGAGLTKTGSTIDVVTASSSRIVVNPDSIDLATVTDSGLGSFLKITRDSYGRVTGTAAVTSSDITSTLGYTPVNRAGDTMTGLLTLSGAPSSSLHAATKAYVDSVVSAGVGGVETISAGAGLTKTGSTIDVGTASSSRIVVNPDSIDLATVTNDGTGSFVKINRDAYGRVIGTSAVTSSDITTTIGYTPFNRAGDTMTGNLTLNGAPTSNLHAATKQYVDSAVAVAAGAGVTLAGAGLTKTGSTIDVGTASSSRIVVNADNIDLATVTDTGTGSLVKISRDSYGRVTGTAAVTSSDITSVIAGAAPRINPTSPVNGDIRVTGSVIDIYAGGAWRQIYPIDISALMAAVACADLSAALDRCGLNQSAASSPTPSPAPAPSSTSYGESVYFNVYADDGGVPGSTLEGEGGSIPWGGPWSNPPMTYYRLEGTGITQNDFNPSHTLDGTVSPGGGSSHIPVYSVQFQIKNDGVTEGVEYATFKLYADSARTILIMTGPTVAIREGALTAISNATTASASYGGYTYTINATRSNGNQNSIYNEA